MPAARYWRVVGISTYGGGDLELSEVALYSGGTRVDGSATFTSTFAPISAGRWAAADVYQPGFALQWDFGVAQDVDDVQFTLPAGAQKFYMYNVEYLDGASWTFAFRWRGTFVGSPQIQYESDDPHFDKVLAILDARSGSATSCLSNTGSDFLQTGSELFSVGSTGGFSPLIIHGTQSFAPEKLTKFVNHTFTGDFSVEILIMPSNASAGQPVYITRFGSTGWGLQMTEFNFSTGRFGLKVQKPDGTFALSLPSVVLYLGLRTVKWIRSNGTHRIVYNGSVQGTFFDDSPITFDRIELGGYVLNCELLNFQQYRVTSGVDRGNADLTAPFPAFVPPPITNTVAAPATRISEYTPPATVTSQIAPAPNRIDIAYGGTATVAGTVKKVPNVPLRRRVRLYDENGRQFIREVWSDAATGEFVFTDLNPVYAYTVITYDYENNYRALTVDKVVAV